MAWRTCTDQLGDKVTLSYPPQRIISLVPSQTELLADLGLDHRVVGITKFCIHPEQWKNSKTVVGGTKNFQMDSIHALKPDLIIGNKEENYPEGIHELKKSYPVWMSDILTITDCLSMISAIGKLTGTENGAHQIINHIKTAIAGIVKLPPLKTLYLIWRKPWMAAGSETFIHEMMKVAGLQNCLDGINRYPSLDLNNLVNLSPELVLLSSEPYPFKEKHIAEIRSMLPDAKIVLVDGEMFSWYGSRLLLFPGYIMSLKNFL